MIFDYHFFSKLPLLCFFKLNVNYSSVFAVCFCLCFCLFLFVFVCFCFCFVCFCLRFDGVLLFLFLYLFCFNIYFISVVALLLSFLFVSLFCIRLCSVSVFVHVIHFMRYKLTGLVQSVIVLVLYQQPQLQNGQKKQKNFEERKRKKEA